MALSSFSTSGKRSLDRLIFQKSARDFRPRCLILDVQRQDRNRQSQAARQFLDVRRCWRPALSAASVRSAPGIETVKFCSLSEAINRCPAASPSSVRRYMRQQPSTVSRPRSSSRRNARDTPACAALRLPHAALAQAKYAVRVIPGHHKFDAQAPGSFEQRAVADVLASGGFDLMLEPIAADVWVFRLLAARQEGDAQCDLMCIGRCETSFPAGPLDAVGGNKQIWARRMPGFAAAKQAVKGVTFPHRFCLGFASIFASV
jgi:hypothetical protein